VGVPDRIRRAGIVAAYRDLHAIPDAQLSIGAAPSREREFHYALWRQAIAALGHPADALDYAMASDGELREMRAVWRHEQAWAPVFVAEDLHTARELAEDYRRDAVIWRAGVDRHPPGSAERDLAERDLAAAEQLAAVYAARVAALEQVQAVRAEWYERTGEARERATYAGDELERRGLDRDTAAAVGEQQMLFRTPDPTTADTTADTTAETAADTAAGTGPARTSAAKDAATDGYAEVFAAAARAADQNRQQPALFDLQPTPTDVAAAQALPADPAPATEPAGPAHTSTGGAGVHISASRPDSEGEGEGADAGDGEQAETVGSVQRQAQIIAALRADIAAAARRPASAAGHEDDDPAGEARRDAGAELDAAGPEPAAAAEQAQHDLSL
jgi:hypothetical protein